MRLTSLVIDSVFSPINIARPLRYHCRFLSTFTSPLLGPASKKCNQNLQKSVRDLADRKIACSLLKIENDPDDEVCELVNGVEVSLGELEDSTHAYLFKAVKNNNETGILLLSDIFGFEDSSTRDFAYRIACNGYNILVPDLFRGNPWSKDQPKAMFEEWIAAQSGERVVKDIWRWTNWMVDEFMAAGISRKLGIVGFCFGGGRVLEVLAQDTGACFGAGVSFYGTRMESLDVSDVKVPVLFILGDNDPLCAVSDVQNINKKLHGGSKVVIFQGRGHGFVHRPGSPEEDADAEKAFTIMREWLNDNLVN